MTDTLPTENTYRKKKSMRKRRKGIVKDKSQIFDQNNMDTRLANNITEGSLIVEDSQVKDEVQSVGQTAVDTGTSVNLTKVNVDGELLDEFQTTTDSSNMDTGSTGNIAEGTIIGKRRRKRKRILMADEADIQCEMDARNLVEGNLIIKKAKINDEVQKTGLTRIDTGSTIVPAEGIVDIGNSKSQDESQSMPRTILDNGQAQSVIIRPEARKMKKKRKRYKTKVQKEMNATSKENLDEENVTIEKLKFNGELQMNTGSIDNLADVKDITKNPNTPVEAQSLDQNTTEMWQLEENHAQGNVAGKRRKKRNRKKGKVNDKVHSEMDTRLTENLAAGNSTIRKPEINGVLRSLAQIQVVTGLTDDVAGGNVTVKRAKRKKRTKKAKGKDEFSSRMDAGSTENLDVVIRTPETRDEVQSEGLKVMDAGSTENLTKGTLTSENPKKNDEGQTMDTGPSEDYAKAGKKKENGRIHAERNVTIENPKVQDEIQSIDQAQMYTPAQDLAEGNVIVNRKKKQKRSKKVKVKDEFSSRMNAKSTENLVIMDKNYRISETTDDVSGGPKVMGAGSTENLTEGSLTFEDQKNKDEGQSTVMVKINSEPANFFTKAGKRKKKRKKSRKPNIVSEFCVSSGAVDGLSQVSNVSVRKRKLLVLDINGLLADVVFPAPKDCKGDIKLYGRAVFRRPFCDDFLNFCFQNFCVGIWSSRSKKVVDKVVSYLLGDQEDKLLFCWDMAHTTKTGFNTLENRHKPLVCKELRKIWEEGDPSWPWKRGDFNESNTLLLDDSPYKALLNPLHTSIFPHPYQYSDTNDNSLGPGGELRVYLEGLAACENVQKYVEQHPYGQSPITEQDVRWEFYDRVLKNIQFAQQ